MPLSFNVAPFWDDYSEEKNFYRILFRPSVAVQARELTQSQTILQQQITNLGNSIYQHGAMVTPGQIATDPKTNYVALQPTYGVILGVPVPINLGTFTSQVIQGETTGLQAQVIYSTAAVGSDPNTLYVKYLNSGTSGETQFDSNEVLDIVGNGAQATAVAVTSGLNVVVNVTMVVGGQGYTTAPTVTITDSTNVLGNMHTCSNNRQWRRYGCDSHRCNKYFSRRYSYSFFCSYCFNWCCRNASNKSMWLGNLRSDFPRCLLYLGILRKSRITIPVIKQIQQHCFNKSRFGNC